MDDTQPNIHNAAYTISDEEEAMNILNCPHCGGTSSLFRNYNRRQDNFFVYVKCDICGAQGKLFDSGTDPAEEDWNSPACKKAVAAWNMRYKEESA